MTISKKPNGSAVLVASQNNIAPSSVAKPKVASAPVQTPKAVAAVPQVQKQVKPTTSSSFASIPQPLAKAGTTMIQNIEEFNTMMKTQFSSAVQSMNIMSKSMEEISKAVFQFYQSSFENNVATAKSLMACKNPQEALDIQSNFAKSSLDSLMAEGGKISQMSIEAANKAFQPIQSSFSQAVESVIKKAA